MTRADLDRFVDDLIARFPADDRAELRLHATAGIRALAAGGRRRLAADVKAQIRTWVEERERGLARRRLVDRLTAYFKIEERHKDELDNALINARLAYLEHELFRALDVKDVRDLGGLIKPQQKRPGPLWETVELLNGLVLGGRLRDEIATSTTDAFGAGVPKPPEEPIGSWDDWADAVDAWERRRAEVDAELREMIDRVAAVGGIAAGKQKPSRKRENDALRAAVVPLIDFWRGVLDRPVNQDHLWPDDVGPIAAKGKTDMADRADKFVYDVMADLAGKEVANGLKTVMREFTDKRTGKPDRGHDEAK